MTLRIELTSGGFIELDIDVKNTTDGSDHEFVIALLQHITTYLGAIPAGSASSGEQS
jgi:hypothetical protein